MQCLTSKIKNKIMMLTTVSILLTLFVIAMVSYNIVVKTMTERLKQHEMPSIVKNILVDLNSHILAPASGLSIIAEDPFIQQWILNGENRADVSLLEDRLLKNTKRFKTMGSNLVVRFKT